MRFDAKTNKSLNEKQDELKTFINQRCAEIITTRFPIWKQQNSNQRLIELVALGQMNGTEWSSLQAEWDWVKSVRAFSNTYHQQLEVADTVETCLTIMDDFNKKCGQL